MRARITSRSTSLENPEDMNMNTRSTRETVQLNDTWDLAGGSGSHFCFVVFQELNILSDQFFSNQLCANRLGKL